jgi:hypothetical protein
MLEKYHLLKIWHVIEIIRYNQKAFSSFLYRPFFFQKSKDNVLLEAFL